MSSVQTTLFVTAIIVCCLVVGLIVLSILYIRTSFMLDEALSTPCLSVGDDAVIAGDAVLNVDPQTNGGYDSCRDILLTSPDPTNGIFLLKNNLGENYEGFCDFYSDHGYTYIRKDSLRNLTTLDGIVCRNGFFILRHLRANGSQYGVEIDQISQYKDCCPPTVLLNEFGPFREDVRSSNSEPFLFVGLLPDELAKVKGTQQGYRSAGEDHIFSNCDGDGNSYFLLFSDVTKLVSISRYYSLLKHWAKDSSLLPTSRQMTTDYFYDFEIHFGGCGGISVTDSYSWIDGGGIVGASVGIRFDVSACNQTVCC